MKKRLLKSVIVNVIFIFAYLAILEPIHESNDDLAISFLVEGAYGIRSPYLVYQNILWGKLLCFLYSLIPNVKWYNILLYCALFVSYVSLAYVFFRYLRVR